MPTRPPSRRPAERSRAVFVALVVLAGSWSVSCATTAPPATAPPPASTPATSPTAGAAPSEVNPAGDIPDTQAYVAYTASDGSFSVSVPEGWARADQGTTVEFTDKLNTVRVEHAPSTTAPNVATTREQVLPRLASARPGFMPGQVSTVRRNAGDGVLLTYRASSPQDPVTGRSTLDAVEHYEFWRGGESVTLTLSGPVGADNVDPWRTITDSLRWSR